MLNGSVSTPSCNGDKTALAVICKNANNGMEITTHKTE